LSHTCCGYIKHEQMIDTNCETKPAERTESNRTHLERERDRERERERASERDREREKKKRETD